jgi:hypothetical protein
LGVSVSSFRSFWVQLSCRVLGRRT